MKKQQYPDSARKGIAELESVISRKVHKSIYGRMHLWPEIDLV